MAPFIAVDLGRLTASALARTPRGLDRVEYLYARHFLEAWPGDSAALLPAPWGYRYIPRERAREAVALIGRLWREDLASADDPLFRHLKRALRGRGTFIGPTERAARPVHRLLPELGMLFGRPAREALPRDSVFLSVGQTGPGSRQATSLLNTRRDLRAVFMMHDTIPLDFPQFVTRREIDAHRKMIAAVAAHGSGLIVTTRAALGSVSQRLKEQGRSTIPTLALGLPPADQFLEPAPIDPDLADHAYFVVCSAFDRRKNYPFLLGVWEQVARRLGRKAPKLVIVANARRQSRVWRLVEKSETLRHDVFCASGLSTAGLRSLMRASRGLLMPSLAEGFGLPIIEALCTGCPVIASDLPAHREAGGKFATYVGASDRAGWSRAIERALGGTVVRPGGDFRPVSSARYFTAVEEFLTSIAGRR
jgi:glycosyltransferase involved in cell wall biosynthesis